MTPTDPGAASPVEPWLTPKGKAIASLLFALFPTCGVGSVLALVLGYRARRELDAEPGTGGRGITTAGVVIGWVGLAGAALGWFLLASAVISGASIR